MPYELGPLPTRVPERLAQRTVRWSAGQQLIDPGLELLQDGLGLLLAQRPDRFHRQDLAARRILFPQRLDPFLDLIDRTDVIDHGRVRQRATGRQLADLARLEEHRPSMLQATEMQQLQLRRDIVIALQSIADELALVRSVRTDKQLLQGGG